MKTPARILVTVALTALTLTAIHQAFRPPAPPHVEDQGRDPATVTTGARHDRQVRDDPSAVPAVSTGRSKRVDVEGQEADPTSPDLSASAPAAAAQTGASLQILVLDAFGDRVVPQCEVALRPVDDAGSFAGRPTKARSGADGVAAMTGLAPGRYLATVGRENGESPRTDGDWFCMPAPVAVTSMSQHLAITLRVRASRQIAGRVVDERGRPVEGAALGVRVESDETVIESKQGERTGADGRFLLRGIAVSEGFDSLVFAELPEYAERGEAHFTCALSTGVVDVGDLVLRGRQSAITGTVVDAAGNPLGGAALVATSRGPSSLTRKAVTATDGSFRIPAVIAGVWDVRAMPYCIGAEGARTVTVGQDGADQPLGTLIAARGVHRLRGLIVDGAQRPVPGATVDCEYGAAEVGADGTFELATCAPIGVAVNVRLRDSDHPMATVERTFPDVRADGVTHRLVLVPTGLLFELELPDDAQGASARALELVAEGPRRRWSRRWSAFSGARLRVQGELPAGEWTFRLTLDGFEPVTLQERIDADLSARELSLTARFKAPDR